MTEISMLKTKWNWLQFRRQNKHFHDQITTENFDTKIKRNSLHVSSCIVLQHFFSFLFSSNPQKKQRMKFKYNERIKTAFDWKWVNEAKTIHKQNRKKVVKLKKYRHKWKFIRLIVDVVLLMHKWNFHFVPHATDSDDCFMIILHALLNEWNEQKVRIDDGFVLSSIDLFILCIPQDNPFDFTVKQCGIGWITTSAWISNSQLFLSKSIQMASWTM